MLSCSRYQNCKSQKVNYGNRAFYDHLFEPYLSSNLLLPFCLVVWAVKWKLNIFSIRAVEGNSSSGSDVDGSLCKLAQAPNCSVQHRLQSVAVSGSQTIHPQLHVTIPFACCTDAWPDARRGVVQRQSATLTSRLQSQACTRALQVLVAFPHCSAILSPLSPDN